MTQANSNSDNAVTIRISAQTDIGVVRQGNEDNFLIVDLDTTATWTADSTPLSTDDLSLTLGTHGLLFAVSDGMGGALAGEVASQLAVNSVRDWMLQFQINPSFQQFPFSERLRLSIEQANLLINTKSQKNAEYNGMGATFTAMGVEGSTLYFAQIGDSRAYLIRKGQIAQITKDQSLVSQLVDAGHITEEEAENHHYKNVILQALGATPSVITVVDSVEFCKDDVILLCSDGLSGKMRNQEMLQILSESKENLLEACNKLIKLANDRGGEDNITTVLLQFCGETLPSPNEEGTFESNLIHRHPGLPGEIDSGLLIHEEPTLSPWEIPPGKLSSSIVNLTPVLPATGSGSSLQKYRSYYLPLIAASIIIVSLIVVAAYFTFWSPIKKVPAITGSPPQPTSPLPSTPSSQ